MMQFYLVVSSSFSIYEIIFLYHDIFKICSLVGGLEHFLFSHILGISSQLTFIFFRGVETTNRFIIFNFHLYLGRSSLSGPSFDQPCCGGLWVNRLKFTSRLNIGYPARVSPHFFGVKPSINELKPKGNHLELYALVIEHCY